MKKPIIQARYFTFDINKTKHNVILLIAHVYEIFSLSALNLIHSNQRKHEVYAITIVSRSNVQTCARF